MMLSWLPNAAPSAARFYWEAAQEMVQGMPTAPVPLPAGVSMFPGEQVRLSRRWAEGRYTNIVYWNELDKGGHFAAFEQPELFVAEVRAAFGAMSL